MSESAIILKASSGWSAIRFPELWHFRDLLFTLAGRDLKLRYKQTALGIVWVILQPLAAAGIFNFVFGVVAGMKTSFTATLAGVTAWALFSSTLSRASTCLVGNSHLISKVYFPRLILPLSTIPSALVDFAVSMALLCVLLIASGVVPGFGLLLLPLWIALFLMLAMGIGLLAASLMVTYRDVGYIVPVITQLLMFASPVAYSSGQVPEKWQLLYQLNPLAPLLEAFRWSLFGEGTVRWNFIAYGALLSATALLIGAFSFKRMERRFADVI